MQRRFLEYTKRKSRMTWKEFRKSLRIGNHVNYRYEVCSLPYRVFTRAIRLAGISPRYANRFKFRLAKEANPNRRFLRLRRNTSLAELVGICLGDGHLRRGTLAIFGSKSDDTPYLVHHVAPLIRRVTGLNAHLNVNRPDENFLALYSTAASMALNRAGLPFGNKIANRARFPR